MIRQFSKTRREFEVRIASAEDQVKRVLLARAVSAPILTRDDEIATFESALLRVCCASERFLEHAMGLHVIGRRTAGGYKAVCKKPNRWKLPQALEALKGDQTYLDWNDPEEVIRRAEKWLRDGEPFQSSLASGSQLLAYVRKMRNVIAHQSDGACRKYRDSTQSLYGSVQGDIEPGVQLSGPPPRSIQGLVGPKLFDSVIKTYRHIAMTIAP